MGYGAQPSPYGQPVGYGSQPGFNQPGFQSQNQPNYPNPGAVSLLSFPLFMLLSNSFSHNNRWDLEANHQLLDNL